MEFIGKWGLTDNISNYIFGTLNINDDGSSSLIIYDSFQSDKTEYILSLNDINNIEIDIIPRIKGYSNGKYIELFHCINSGNVVNLGGLMQPKVSYNAKYVLIYNSAKISSEIREISVRFDKLNQWACGEDTTVKINYNTNKVSFESQTTEVWSFEREKNKIKIATEFEAKTVKNIRYSFEHFYFYGYEYKENIEINQQNIVSIIDNILPFKFLLEVLVNEKVSINKVSLIDINKGKIDVYFSGIDKISVPTISNNKIASMIYLPHIKDNFNDILFKFESNLEKYTGAIAFILDDNSKDLGEKYKIDSFVKEAGTAIEAFMRNSRSILNEEDEGEFDSKIERIYKLQQQADLKWLKEKLKYSNNASLRKQTKMFFEEFEQKLPKISKSFFTKEEKNLFIDGFIKARNFYTHYDLTAENPMSKVKQFCFCKIIKEMLRMIIMCDIGIEANIIEERENLNQDLIHNLISIKN